MSLKIFKNQDYEFTHENEQFRELVEILKKRFNKTDELNLLFANIYFGGVPLDALFVKRNAIIVLEFKNYTGNLTASENGSWELSDGTLVKGGAGKNPYMQTRANKFSVLNELNTWFPRPYVNLGQISGVVVFNQSIKVAENRISPKSMSWFHICDMDGIGNKLEDIASPGICYTDSDLLDFPRIVNCKDAYYESPAIQTTIQRVEQHVVVQPQVLNVNTSLSDAVKRILENNDYEVIENGERVIPAKEAKFHQGPIELGKQAQEYIRRNYATGLYNHQYEAAKLASEGKNVCVATSTSSGKTAIFHLAALEILEKDPEAKIIAVYPMKALGNQQVNSWNEKLQNVRCGRIDGNVNLNNRLEILRDCSIVTFTPDTIHTFLLGKLKDSRCIGILKEFIKKLKLVIIDEVHLYRGMLGSNSAYMFRRLNACALLSGGKVPQYITASATMNEPLEHSANITGASSFELIGSEMDSSPSCQTKMFFIRRGRGVEELVRLFKNQLPDNCRTITFMDNREDVERVASEIDNANTLAERRIFSFRSGYEGEFYDETLDALQNNRFKGVISTSSLEVGIDIANLNVAILDGVPNSSTSFYQRIGRVGRGNTNDEAVVIIMEKQNSLNTYLAFKDPQGFSLPSEEPALYLQNKNLINIQALHFVGTGEELQSITSREVVSEYNKICDFFPPEFNDVCHNILIDQLQGIDGYRTVMDKGGENPEFVYTIRNFDAQFDVFKTNNQDESLETLTMQNILRQAYPGAIHTCRNIQWRVKKVDRTQQTVFLEQLRGESRHNKTEVISRVSVIPQRLSSIRKHLIYGGLHVVNLEIDEKTIISGFKEKNSHGREIDRINYKNSEVHYTPNNSDFKYTLPTEGVIFCHPSLDSIRQVSLIATLLYNCFLSRSAFERSDIENRAGRLNTEIDGIAASTPFFTIYDKNTNGLNITSRLMDRMVLLKGFETMIDIIENNKERNFLGDKVTLVQETKDAIRAMYNELRNQENPEVKAESVIPDFHIARKSRALYEVNPDELMEVIVDVVQWHDKYRTILYELLDTEGNEIDGVIPEALVYPIKGVSYKADFSKGKSTNTGVLW